MRIVEGVEEKINIFLEIKNYKTKTHALKINWPRIMNKKACLSKEIYEQLVHNVGNEKDLNNGWSCKNWRFTQEKTLDPQNTQIEKIIEKNFISSQECPNRWANQVPTCSRSRFPDTSKRSIDLVERKNKNEYVFYELKVKPESGHPFYAAIEVLIYGIFYLFRQKGALIDGNIIHLVVIAPNFYYVGWEDEIENITKFINKDITHLYENLKRNEKIDFSFESFENKYDNLFQKKCDKSDESILIKITNFKGKRLINMFKTKNPYRPPQKEKNRHS